MNREWTRIRTVVEQELTEQTEGSVEHRGNEGQPRMDTNERESKRSNSRLFVFIGGFSLWWRVKSIELLLLDSQP